MLPLHFYQEHDALYCARELLGKLLVTRINGVRTAGIITETEAYSGVMDRASHAFGGRRTPRNEAMYAAGGIAYVYVCYGIHHLFNVVVCAKEEPQAVLIRAIHPTEGLRTMCERRGAKQLTTGGPGTLTQALAIRTTHNGDDLHGPRIWIEDRGSDIAGAAVLTGPRIGVAYAGADALLPYRFRIAPSYPL